MENFSKKVLELLESKGKDNKYYVYRLIDPRTMFTFYVGKGCGNRVFEHARAAIKDDDADSLKIQQIKEILASGKEVIYMIHRWGLTEETALEVEATLIDCYPELTNIQCGFDSRRGMISVEDLERVADATTYQEPEEDYILIKTKQSTIKAAGSLYEATRSAWKASLSRAEKYNYVLSVVNGVVREVYRVKRWYAEGDRIAFEGEPATGGMASLKGRLIPDKYEKPGMSNPFLYKKEK